jgi:hypothetical protein
MDTGTAIPLPDFVGLPMDLNSVKRVYLEAATGISRRMASEIAAQQPFGHDIADFQTKMYNSRTSKGIPATDEFKQAIATVVALYKAGKLRLS